MRTVLVAVCSAMAGFGMAASPALAKTVKECQAEWLAHRDVFQPKGISQRDYVDECRGFPAPAPETTAIATPAPEASVPAVVKPAPEASVPAVVKPAPAAAAPAAVKPPHVAVAVPAAPSHVSTEAHAIKAKKPETTNRVAARAEVNSKPPPEPDRSARSRSAVASPPPVTLNYIDHCLSQHSGTIIHSERCP